MQKYLLALALLVASSMPMVAEACFGCGVKFNGVSSNGLQLNGAKLNDIKWNGVVLNGLGFNDIKWNGLTLNGWSLNGWTLNGYRMNGLTLNGLTLNGLTLNGFKINGKSFNGTLFNGSGAWRAAAVARTTSVDGWSAIPLQQVRVACRWRADRGEGIDPRHRRLARVRRSHAARTIRVRDCASTARRSC